jgi:hypothetical protein
MWLLENLQFLAGIIFCWTALLVQSGLGCLLGHAVLCLTLGPAMAALPGQFTIQVLA